MSDIDDDYEKARETYYDLLRSGQEGIEAMVDLAKESDHPRAFEVLATMLKTNADIADKLMALQKAKKDIEKKDAPALEQRPTINNNMFVGSTSDLQKLLQAKMEKQINE